MYSAPYVFNAISPLLHISDMIMICIYCVYIYMHIVTEGRFIVKLQSCLDQGKVLGEKVVSPKIYHERVSRRFVQCVAWGCLQLKC